MSKEIGVGMGMDEIIIADRLGINESKGSGIMNHRKKDHLHRSIRSGLARGRRRNKFWEQFSIAHRN